ncbi:MAG: energy transducer TonB [Kiloniellaceae bacterium]
MSAKLTRPRSRHWSLALGAALLLHAALAVVFHQLVDGGAVASGRGGIEVGLALAGGTQGSPESDAAPEAVGGVEVAEAVAAESPPPEAAEVPPEAITEAVPVSEITAATAAPVEVPLYAPVETVEAEVAAAAETAVTEVTEPVPSEATETMAVETEPVEETLAEPVMALPPTPKSKPLRQDETPQPEVPDTAEADSQDPEASEAAAATATAVAVQEGAPAVSDQIGNNGKAGIGARAAVGTSEGRSGGGAPGAFIDYEARLLAWLEKHKEYPRRARLRRQEGTAILHFVIDRAGRVLEYHIERSSGYKLLDTEVAAMIERASPLPEVPDKGNEERFVFVIPVNFNLR